MPTSPPLPPDSMSQDAQDTPLKEALKEAVIEALHEQREWLQDVIADVLQEMALSEALREIEATTPRSKDNGFGMVEGEA